MPVRVEDIPSFVLKINNLNSRERKTCGLISPEVQAYSSSARGMQPCFDNIIASFRKQWVGETGDFQTFRTTFLDKVPGL